MKRSSIFCRFCSAVPLKEMRMRMNVYLVMMKDPRLQCSCTGVVWLRKSTRRDFRFFDTAVPGVEEWCWKIHDDFRRVLLPLLLLEARDCDSSVLNWLRGNELEKESERAKSTATKSWNPTNVFSNSNACIHVGPAYTAERSLKLARHSAATTTGAAAVSRRRFGISLVPFPQLL